MLLLGVIFVTLIAGSVQSVTADHLEPGQGIYKDENSVNLVSTKDSKYQIYIQVQVRNEQGQLVSISEASRGNYLPHEMTDYVFNEKLGKKEIIIIDNIKYEKVQYINTVDMKQLKHTIDPTSAFIGSLVVNFCGEIISGHEFSCISIFQIDTSVGVLSETDVITNKWTILRELN
tara:strand:+ start:62 stop:586 length:525 start_codon:yes stop_codon:yes gene_type:complete